MNHTRFSVTVTNNSNHTTIVDLEVGDIFSFDNGNSWYIRSTEDLYRSICIYPDYGSTSSFLFNCEKSVPIIIAKDVNLQIIW